MVERNKAVPAVYLILLKDDEILLMQRAGSGYYDGWYSLPAGHVEYREMPIDALVRECEEEIGIVFTREDIKFAHLLYREAHDETGDRADMFFLCEVGDDVNPVIGEPEKCTDLMWCKTDGLPKNMVQNVRLATEKALAGEMYSELGFDALEKFTKEYEDSLI